MFWIAPIFGSLYIIGRGLIGMLITMPSETAAWFWPAALWTALCLAATRAAYRAYRDAPHHLDSPQRLKALARPATLMFLVAGLATPKLPTTAASIAVTLGYAAILSCAGLLTAFPRAHNRIDRSWHGESFAEQRAADHRRVGVPVRPPRKPIAPALPRVAPYARQQTPEGNLSSVSRGARPRAHVDEVIRVHYDGKLAAVATPDDYFLLGRYSHLPEANPEARFVSVMATYAMEIASGARSGEYTDEAARIVARATLVPHEVFERGIVDRDATARAYGVPIWELGPEAINLTKHALTRA